jgi:hypothetical protein
VRTLTGALLEAQSATTRVPYIYMLFTLDKTAATLAFVASSKRITDSANGLSAFRTGDTIVVSGSGSNNGTFTIAAGGVAAYITVNESLLDESAGSGRTITTTQDLSTDSAAYGNRIISIDHVEEVYNEYALVLLSNRDKSLPPIKGYWTEIGYGDGTAYAGDGSTGGSRKCSRLWIKSQQTISTGGKLYTILEMEGMWSRLRETLVSLGSAPKHENNLEATSYSILETLIETEMGWTLDAIGSQSDSIINVLTLDFDVNNKQFEYMAGIIYRLIRLTKTFLRAESNLTFEVRYPQTGDSVDLTFTSDSAPFFYTYTNRDIIHIPNRMLVYGKAGVDGLWLSFVTGDEQDSTSIDAYTEIRDIALAPDITSAPNADLLAAALLSKIKAESVVGIGKVPHHAAVELLDKIAFVDNRVSADAYPDDGTVRVGGLRHIYKPGQYKLEITLGGQSVSGEIARQAGAANIVFTDVEEQQLKTVYSPLTPPDPISAGWGANQSSQVVYRGGGYAREGVSYAEIRDINSYLDEGTDQPGTTAPWSYPGSRVPVPWLRPSRVPIPDPISTSWNVPGQSKQLSRSTDGMFVAEDEETPSWFQKTGGVKSGAKRRPTRESMASQQSPYPGYKAPLVGLQFLPAPPKEPVSGGFQAFTAQISKAWSNVTSRWWGGKRD